jgi:hypothetical protein
MRRQCVEGAAGLGAANQLADGSDVQHDLQGNFMGL